MHENQDLKSKDLGLWEKNKLGDVLIRKKVG